MVSDNCTDAVKPPGGTSFHGSLRAAQYLLILWFLATWPAPTVAEELLFGMKIGAIPEEDAAYRNIDGAYVIEVESGSAAEQAGLQAGHVIIAVQPQRVGRLAVTNADEVVALIEDAAEQGHRSILLHLVKPPSETWIHRGISLR